MRRIRLVLAVAVGLAAACFTISSPRGQAVLPVPDDAVAKMVAEVSKERLAETLTALCSIPTRYSPTSGCRLAGTSIYNYFARLGLAVEYEHFKYNSPRVAGGATGRNVVATLAGTGVPERMVVVGAHYDSFSTNEFRVAPGADDNATGVAAVLEIARIFSRRRFGLTVRFIAFDAEELGLFGSEHAAGGARAKRESIVAMLNLDMVGVSDGGRRALALVPDRDGQWLADRFMHAAKRYGIVINLVKRVYAKWARSDQASFWAAGFPALGLCENEPDNTKQYHHVGDTPDTLDMDFLTAVTRATLATVAELALQPAAGPTRQ
jgi:Zn-dependent M28 family amino/carboxypeptidase